MATKKERSGHIAVIRRYNGRKIMEAVATYNRTMPFAMAAMANMILGLSSIYWHIFSGVSPIVLVAYRVCMSFLLLIAIVLLTARLRYILQNITIKIAVVHGAAAVLVAINWGTFIWASIHGNVLESGLGYLVAPVFVMLAGITIYNETDKDIKLTGIAIVTFMLGLLVIASGNLAHWVYLTIGATWGAYTILKKETPFKPIDGLLIETTVLLSVIVLASILLMPASETNTLNWSVGNAWIYACGIVSVSPLVMFAFAARHLDSYSMGTLQFMLPTTQLCVSILYYKQEVSTFTYMSFASIWLVLLFITYKTLQTKDV